jgi:hypothetical protein
MALSLFLGLSGASGGISGEVESITGMGASTMDSWGLGGIEFSSRIGF